MGRILSLLHLNKYGLNVEKNNNNMTAIYTNVRYEKEIENAHGVKLIKEGRQKEP